jgi:hypothetical protein
MIGLDAATVALQWAAGGLAFCWVTTRHRLVGLGYGWLLRAVYGSMALLAVILGLVFDPQPVRDLAALGTAVAAAVALRQSVVRRRAGVEGQLMLAEARSDRVAAMTGIDRLAGPKDGGPEFDPRLDLLAPAAGLLGVS